MGNRILIISSLGLALSLAALSCVANPFSDVRQSSVRCGKQLVKVGQRAFQLIDKCGEPLYREVVAYSRQTDTTNIRAGGRQLAARDSVDLVTEQWIYKPGRGRFTRIMTVTGGILTDIRLADRQ
ncbi:MAG: DUF2845 domain-containing protein [Lysobacterales bacterium]